MKAGWATVALEELCVVDWGNTALTKASYIERGKFLAVSAAGCDGRIAHKEHLKHTPVLSAIGARCGTMFWPEEDFTAIKNTITLTPKTGKCDSRFLYHLLTFVRLPQRGAGQPFISKGDIQSFRVTSPEAVPEQQRIVGILDKAFDGIAAAKANAEKNLQNARVLFESYLQTVFTRRGEGWKKVTLGTVATFRNGINFTKESKGERVKVVGVKDFQRNFLVPLHDLATVTIDGRLPESDVLKKGDILAVRSNGNLELIGRCLLANEVPDRMSHSGFTIRIRLQSDDLIPEYLCHFMKSGESRKRLIAGGTGTNIKSLNQQGLASLLVPFPPRTQQRAIVNAISEMSAETQHLESLYRQKLGALDALKQSLLHQAFTGEL